MIKIRLILVHQNNKQIQQKPKKQNKNKNDWQESWTFCIIFTEFHTTTKKNDKNSISSIDNDRHRNRDSRIGN